ncbi:hypothetical protein GCK32_021150, partial [Trichostrongylus colubriformis]
RPQYSSAIGSTPFFYRCNFRVYRADGCGRIGSHSFEKQTNR